MKSINRITRTKRTRLRPADPPASVEISNGKFSMSNSESVSADGPPTSVRVGSARCRETVGQSRVHSPRRTERSPRSKAQRRGSRVRSPWTLDRVVRAPIENPTIHQSPGYVSPFNVSRMVAPLRGKTPFTCFYVMSFFPAPNHDRFTHPFRAGPQPSTLDSLARHSAPARRRVDRGRRTASRHRVSSIQERASNFPHQCFNGFVNQRYVHLRASTCIYAHVFSPQRQSSPLPSPFPRGPSAFHPGLARPP
jgi:hypothetical protein